MNLSLVDLIVILGFFLSIPGAIKDTLDLLQAIKKHFDGKRKGSPE